jgi:hypothetical protein
MLDTVDALTPPATLRSVRQVIEPFVPVNGG